MHVICYNDCVIIVCFYACTNPAWAPAHAFLLGCTFPPMIRSYSVKGTEWEEHNVGSDMQTSGIAIPAAKHGDGGGRLGGGFPVSPGDGLQSNEIPWWSGPVCIVSRPFCLLHLSPLSSRRKFCSKGRRLSSLVVWWSAQIVILHSYNVAV